MNTVTDPLPAPCTHPRARTAAVTPAPQPRLLTGPVVRLFLTDLAAMVSFYLLLSVVPLYAADRGIGTAGAGLTTGVLMLTAVAAELATPALAARLGYRRLLIGGLVLLGAPALVLPAAASLPALLLLSVVRGIGFAIVVVTVGAIAATAIPAQRRGEGLGVLGVVAMLPAVGALPLGVWLAAAMGYAAVFAIGGGAALLAVMPVLRLPEGRSENQSHSGLSTCLRRPELRRPLVMFATTAVAGGVVIAFLPSAVTAVVAVPALFVQNIAATAARWLAGRRIDRHGSNGMLAPAVLICAVGMGSAAFTSTPLAVLAGMAAFGAGFGLAQAATLNTMLARVPASQYGAVSAAWNAAYDLGWGAGAIGIGMVAATAGYPAAFAVAAVLVLAALPLDRRTEHAGRAVPVAPRDSTSGCKLQAEGVPC
jgi:predicted MFS family arabinose efflux permease